ncbi:GGDEF domain-containing protein [Cryobacterium sp. PH31-AA6]|uniref:tetratricopeptide repeat-containing diguanylate cyclase n=1 Tax=Cryobacterium sp. PH31-AA6 TaxID=3046205 RepID=UPI0024BB4DBD|nr:GGDEF domain-containing protein [Cryobacterium sp. PH31-AA6]MDJ0324778.1 GGDEF domain-containing protein [Cryobacterium sp. PH31-AA6]
MNSNHTVSERRGPPQDALTASTIEGLLQESERFSAAGRHLEGAASGEQVLATPGVTPSQQARAREMLALHRLRLGDYQAAVRNGLQALEFHTATGDLLRQSRVHCTLALAYTDTSLTEQALSHAVPALETARACGSRLAEFWALTRASTVHGAMGDTERGVDLGRQALALSETLDDTDSRLVAVNNLGDSCLETALAQRAAELDASLALQEGLVLFREAVALANAQGNNFIETIALTNLVSILIELNEHDEAREKAHRCKDLAHANGFRNLEVNVDAQLAEVVRAEGNLEEATAMMDAQLACPSIDEDLALQIRLHQALYEMHKQRRRFEQALGHCEKLNKLTLQRTVQTAGLQSQLLINTLEVEQARHEIERSQLEAEVQRIRAEELDDQAHTDPLTLLPNRRALDRELPRLMDRARDLSQPLCAAMIDFDNFKLVNDEYGHATGDLVLTTMAQMLRAVTRETDLAVRVGGEEFLLVFGNTELDQATLACERLLTSVRDYAWGDVAAGLTCTVSAGLAALEPAERVAHWLERADTALYDAKSRGRDQVVTVDVG